jgi:hypothetical protein
MNASQPEKDFKLSQVDKKKKLRTDHYFTKPSEGAFPLFKTRISGT